MSTLLRRAGRSSRTARGTAKALLLILFLPAWIAGHPAIALPGIDPTTEVAPSPSPTLNGLPLPGFGDSPLPTYDGLPFTVASDYPEPTYNGLPLSLLGFL